MSRTRDSSVQWDSADGMEARLPPEGAPDTRPPRELCREGKQCCYDHGDGLDPAIYFEVIEGMVIVKVLVMTRVVAGVFWAEAVLDYAIQSSTQ